MKKFVNGLILSVMISSSIAMADAPSVKFGGVSNTGGGLQLIGTIMTFVSDGNKYAVGAGWALIVFGSLVENRDLAFGAQEDSSMRIVLGTGAQVETPVSEVLQNVEVEAFVAANQPNMVPSLTLSHYAENSGVEATRIAQLILTSKDVAAKTTGGVLNPTQVTEAFGVLTPAETKIVRNYMTLRSIVVTDI